MYNAKGVVIDKNNFRGLCNSEIVCATENTRIVPTLM